MEQELIKEERMTSLQIAEIVGKTHAHVMRDIRNMEESWYKVSQSKFGLSS
jgi:phage regulator Rha-like protein